MTLNIAALRHRAEMAEKFANDGPDAPILDGRLRVFAKDLLALLDAAEERTKLRQYLDDAQDDLWKVREERDRLRSQRDALLAAAETTLLTLKQWGVPYDADALSATVRRIQRETDHA